MIYKTVEEFIDFLKDILIYPDEFKTDGYFQTFCTNGKLYFIYEPKKDRLTFSNDYIFEIFKKEYGLNDKEIQVLIKNMLKKHFNMETTKIYVYTN